MWTNYLIRQSKKYWCELIHFRQHMLYREEHNKYNPYSYNLLNVYFSWSCKSKSIHVDITTVNWIFQFILPHSKPSLKEAIINKLILCCRWENSVHSFWRWAWTTSWITTKNKHRTGIQFRWKCYSLQPQI